MKRSGSRLSRVVGLPGACLIGLGSILGSGVFVALGVAYGVAGRGVIPAVILAALLALCNGLSSAQLAASHPVSGGTYEYGYRYLSPLLGYSAGWMFLIAKSASAATAALGCSAYFLTGIGKPLGIQVQLFAIIVVATMTLLVLLGVKRSNHLNFVLVSLSLGSLFYLIGAWLLHSFAASAAELSRGVEPARNGSNDSHATIVNTLHATALMFVAYTGYGRIATMGEEVARPAHTIPRAVLVTLAAVAAIYLAVSLAMVSTLKLGDATSESATYLKTIANHVRAPYADVVLTIGAGSALLGVLLNLILGLSRVVLAMGRRGDLPALFARIDDSGASPYPAVVLVGSGIAALAVIGDVKITWSFSAFMVLLYYALTNLAALRLVDADRLFPRWIAVVDLGGCLFLAFWVERWIWLTGIGLLLLGWAFRSAIRSVMVSR